MSRVLLDTQIVLWAGGHVDRLSNNVRELLLDPANEVYVSAVSIAEMVIKQSIGKLSLPLPAIDFVDQLSFDDLELSAGDAQRMAQLPLLHRDPFDRLLIAQAIDRDLTLITADHQIWQYPVVNIIRCD
jgi:PIN domain nuclease of toxin-antitoxin system